MFRSLLIVASLIIGTLSLGCSGTAHTATSTATSTAPGDETQPIVYSLPALPYSTNALEPYIDAETMKIHHGAHHQAYVDNLNKALKNSPASTLALESLLATISTQPTAVRNNAGGHWNHSFFWRILTPAKNSGIASPKLLNAIESTYGSLSAFKEKFNEVATGRFGSGWAWLVKTDNGLAIFSTPNQDNPLMDVADLRGKPILAVDVWEHAYYLKYKNKRAEYLKNWWNVVNWAEVSRLYEEG